LIYSSAKHHHTIRKFVDGDVPVVGLDLVSKSRPRLPSSADCLKCNLHLFNSSTVDRAVDGRCAAPRQIRQPELTLAI
jgi:hypothetical protein